MLAVAVGAAGVWPNTRTQAFDMACRTLLADHNDEHRIAGPDLGGITDLIEASGKLCAVQILAGAAGYALLGAESDQHFLGLDRLKGTERQILRRCLESKLFEYPAERRTVPVHRQVAEFLAARRHCDVDPLLALIDEKRADHRMSLAQRIHWLVAGL